MLRACHCEETKLKNDLEHYRDQLSLDYPNAAEKLAICEAELEMLHAAIRKLWLA